MRSWKRRSHGFTIVEAAVVMLALGVALAATAKAVTQAARLDRTAADMRAATYAAVATLEEARATPFASVSTNFAGLVRQVSSFAPGDGSGTCAVTVTPIDTGSAKWQVLAVTATVSWTGFAGAESRSYTTYVSDRAAVN